MTPCIQPRRTLHDQAPSQYEGCAWLFEEPVPENYKAGRQVLHSILGRDDFPLDRPVLCFATNPILSAMAKPGLTSIVWETNARLATGGKSVLMEVARSECLMEFLSTFSYILSTYLAVFVHTSTCKYKSGTYNYIVVHTSMFSYILVHTSISLRHTTTYSYIQV